MGFTGRISPCQQGGLPFWKLLGRSLSCFFQLWKAALAGGFLQSSEPAMSAMSFSLWHSCLPSSLYKGSCDYSRPTGEPHIIFLSQGQLIINFNSTYSLIFLCLVTQHIHRFWRLLVCGCEGVCICLPAIDILNCCGLRSDK